MMKIVFFLTIIFFTLFSLPSMIYSETLEDAWQTALSFDKRILASQQNVESGRQNLLAAKSARLPTLSLESGYTILNNEPGAVFQSSGTQSVEVSTAEDKSFSYKASVNVPLFTSGRIAQSIDAATSALNTALHNETGTVQDVKLRVAESYVSVLRTGRMVEVSESNVSSLLSHTRDVENFYKQGMITRNDLLASQVALADARQKALQSRNGLNLATASYNRILGRPLDQKVSLDDLIAEPLKPNLEELTKKALQKRPELLSLSEQAKALKHQAAGTRSSTMPQLALSGGYNYQQNRYQAYEDVWSATLGLKWEIFDGGVSRHNANALFQQAEAVNSILADTTTVIALQVRQACLDMEETLQRIEVTKEAIAQSEENLKVVKDRYREGVGTNTEVLDAETLRIRSYSNYYNAVYDAVLAKIRLLYTAGDL
jgi:outer membrane protein TolC